MRNKKPSVKFDIHLSIIFTIFLFLLVGTSHVLADQVTLSFVNANANTQTMVLNCNTSREDLALASSLIGQEGVAIKSDTNAGCGSLPEIAASVATQAPLFAPDIAEAFAFASFYESEMIVDAISEVPGVNTVAVRSAVSLEPSHSMAGQPADAKSKELSASLETRRERRASRN